MIEVKIIADSLAPSGSRLTTFVLTYPRFIHSEFMTHRMLSRNASSSRAIPVSKQIDMVVSNPAIPLAFTKNQKGMQGGQALSGEEHEKAVAVWLQARDRAVVLARELADLEVHKQYANRILEPFAHITVVVSATEWTNFFALRYHSMAQPEICELAKQMWAVYSTNKPKVLQDGEWHIPFVNEELKSTRSSKLTNEVKTPEQWSANVSFNYEYDDELIKQSVARCARVSYLNHEGKTPTLEQDLQLYDRLLGQLPIHASPAEHQAMAVDEEDWSGNFKGWVQYRKTLDHENINKFDPPEEV